MEYHVNYIAEGQRVTVPAGTTLLEAQRLAQLPADAPCGGKGTCKKCAVEYRGAGDAAWRRELACRVTVDRDM
ncbi:MAG: 2Fe-2S iron-sulfur cluster binding domain-containing protein, partial [Clostridia bacterium]|nr:2Fe-2S iron-sulfur cluster binding domain-containing protein [Clostridia bacterium]